MTMDPALEKFEVRLTVTPADIDQLGHVNNLVYLKWVQDAAVAHWAAEAAPEDQAALFWVITRQEIDYKRPAFEGDDIVVRTWVGRAQRRAFDRHTEILRATDGKALAIARTVWCPVDSKTLRPVDVTETIRERFSIPSLDCPPA
jgi:acyl-CoA thioester hydrolase